MEKNLLIEIKELLDLYNVKNFSFRTKDDKVTIYFNTDKLTRSEEKKQSGIINRGDLNGI